MHVCVATGTAPLSAQVAVVKKDIEIQPGFKPGPLNSSQMLLPTEPLELWDWSRG